MSFFHDALAPSLLPRPRAAGTRSTSALSVDASKRRWTRRVHRSRTRPPSESGTPASLSSPGRERRFADIGPLALSLPFPPTLLASAHGRSRRRARLVVRLLKGKTEWWGAVGAGFVPALLATAEHVMTAGEQAFLLLWC